MRISDYIGSKRMTLSAAAASLDISRQRLHSYTSGTSLPGSEMFDRIRERWGLDLLGGAAASGVDGRPSGESSTAAQAQFDFREPLTLSSDDVKVVIERIGRKLIARVEIRATVKTA